MITTSGYEDLSDLFCILKNDADTGYISEPMQSQAWLTKMVKKSLRMMLLETAMVLKAFFNTI